jgi:hypothetical protein
MIIIDSFLKDGEFKKDLMSEFRWEKSVPYSWYDFNYNKETSNIWEDFASHVWGNIYNPKEQIDPAGFEYWTNNVPQNGRNNLDWHYDKDEHLWSTSNILTHPYVGFVYYCHDIMPVGGFLEIQKSNGECERLEPVPNRLIIFDPSENHRVIKVDLGNRWTFASNLWIDRPMMENFI